MKFRIDDYGTRPKYRLWLLVKFYWYKYIRRLDIVGFYAGVPVVRTEHLVEESKNISPEQKFSIWQ